MAGEFLRVTASLAAAATTSATVFVAADLTLFFTGGGEGNSLGSATETARFLWPIAFGVASLHALGLGWPAYLAAKRLGLTRWWVGLSGGFLTGSFPYSVLALPWRAPPEQLVAAHIVAPFTWTHYFAAAGGLGLLGMTGGMAAWTVWRALGGAMPRAVAAPPP